MKSMKISGKRIPTLAIIMVVLIIGIASAALVTSFVEHQTTVRVSTPVELDSYSHELDLYAGECTEEEPISINITNHANVETYAGIETSIYSTEYGTEDEGPDTGLCVHYTLAGDVVTEITIPANGTGENTLELMMHVCTAPRLAPVDYTIWTNFIPSDEACVTPTPISE